MARPSGSASSRPSLSTSSSPNDDSLFRLTTSHNGRATSFCSSRNAPPSSEACTRCGARGANLTLPRAVTASTAASSYAPLYVASTRNLLLRGVEARDQPVEFGAAHAAHRVPHADVGGERRCSAQEDARKELPGVRYATCGAEYIVGPAMAAIHERSAAELAAAFASGELSPLHVARALLERIEAWEPRINAMYRVHREAALEQARASEARWRSRPAALAARRRAAHHQGEHLHARRSGAGRHARQRGRAAAGRRRARRGAGARGRLRDPRQDHDARLRHAVLGPVEPARRDAQSLAPRPQSVGLELRRGRRRGRGLRAAAPRHRHRRLGAPAGDALRHLRPQALARPRAGQSAVHGPRRGADDAHREGRGAPHEPHRAPRCARLHEPALPGSEFRRAAAARPEAPAHRLSARHGRRPDGPSRGPRPPPRRRQPRSPAPAARSSRSARSSPRRCSTACAASSRRARTTT